MTPLTPYIPFEHVNVGDFVLMRLHDPNLVPMWMGRAQCDIVKDEESDFFKCVKVQWWVLMNKGSNLDEQLLYEDCWNGKWGNVI
jgi:hypothetical protein